MKKHYLSLLLSLVVSSCLLAQSTPPSDSENGTPAAPVGPTQHLEATYNIASKQAKPMGTVTWVADLKNDAAPYLYQVTVTLQNDTDKVFGTWSLVPLFVGSITTQTKDVMVDDPNNPGQQIKAVVESFDVSPEVQIRTYMFSDGPAPGYAIFGGVLDQGTMNLAPHGSITFTYNYQLPASQQTVEAPAKFILSRGISYVMGPVTPAPADATPANL